MNIDINKVFPMDPSNYEGHLSAKGQSQDGLFMPLIKLVYDPM